MTVEQDRVYWFTKSGNRVRTIGFVLGAGGVREWEVERVDGDSVGKRMLVREVALTETID